MLREMGNGLGTCGTTCNAAAQAMHLGVLWEGKAHQVGLLLQPHDSGQVGLEPDAVPDQLRQLLVHQSLLLLEALP